MPADRNILLVDDYEINRVIGKKLLESDGYNVDLAVDGSEAVLAYESKKYDLILMDIEMPVLNGCECTGRIRSLENTMKSTGDDRVPIIAMSGHALESDGGRYRQAGMDDCLAKPIEREQLLAIVSKWISRRAECLAEQQAGRFSVSRQNRQPAADRIPVAMDKVVDEFLGDRDLVSHLLDEFVRKGIEQLATVGQALSQNDFEKIRREAHALKGGAANLTAHSLADRCGGLEKVAEAGFHADPEQLKMCFSKLKKEFKRLAEFVSQNREPNAGTGQS